MSLWWFCSFQDAAPHLAKALLWEPAMPGPLPLLPPCPGKGLRPLSSLCVTAQAHLHTCALS